MIINKRKSFLGFIDQGLFVACWLIFWAEILSVIVANMLKGEKMDNFEKIQSEMCDYYCRKPFECTEEELEATCERCPLLKLKEDKDGVD